jgi:predicted ArsR family transcriptional regulator
MHRAKRLGRPSASPVPGLIVAHLRIAGPLTAREVAYALQLAVPAACVELHRLCQSGRVAQADRIVVVHMKRPAWRYVASEECADPSPWAVLSSWPRK